MISVQCQAMAARADGDPTSTPADFEPAGLLTSMGYLLARLGMESRRMWSHTLAAHGVTPHHFGVLMTLDQLGAASQQELSRLVGVDPRNVVPLLDFLEAKQLIRRQTDPTDRRRRALKLTTAGRRLLGELRRAGDQVERELLEDLSESERQSLQLLLQKLYASRTRRP